MTRKGWLLFTTMSVIWGIPYLFIKVAVWEIDPTVVVFARVGVLLPVAAKPQGVREHAEITSQTDTIGMASSQMVEVRH